MYACSHCSGIHCAGLARRCSIVVFCNMPCARGLLPRNVGSIWIGPGLNIVSKCGDAALHCFVQEGIHVHPSSGILFLALPQSLQMTRQSNFLHDDGRRVLERGDITIPCPSQSINATLAAAVHAYDVQIRPPVKKCNFGARFDAPSTFQWRSIHTVSHCTIRSIRVACASLTSSPVFLFH